MSMKIKLNYARQLWLSLLLLVGVAAIAVPTLVENSEGTIEISTVDQLKEFRDAVNSGNTYAGKTVKLTADLDLSSESNWTPIGNLVAYPGQSFNGTFDGDGHSISNVTVNDNTPNYAVAGLFGSVENGTIKNLTVKNVDLTSTHYAGGIVAYTSNGPTIENCKVIGGTIKSTPEVVDGSYDNGDKVGGIMGYATAGSTINNCTVEGVTITAYRDMGGIVGFSAGTVTNNTAINVTVTQDLTNGYKDPAPTTFGDIIGRDGGATLSNNKVIKGEPVAKIGDEKYYSLADAVAAAQLMGGAVTVELIEDISGETVTIKEVANFKLTIDGKNKTVDATIVVDGLRGNGGSTTNGASVTLQNIAFVNNVAKDVINPTGYPHNLTIENCTYTGSTTSLKNWFVNVTDGPLYGATIKNVTVESSRLIQGDFSSEVVFESIVATNNAYVGFNIKTGDSGGHTGTVLIKDCQVTTAKYAFRDISDDYNGTITLEGNTFISTSTESDEGAIVNRGGLVGTGHINVVSGTYNGPIKVLNNKEGVLAISGGYFSQEFPQEYIAADLVAQGKVCTPATDKPGFYTIGDPHYVAQIGETGYVTLQAALDAAHETTGDVTITLLDDITGYSIVHQKAGLNLTIDGADKTVAGQIIIDGDGRLAGTETLTIKNIKFEGNETNFYTGTDAFIIVPTTKTAGDPYYTNKYNYAHNVTVDKCSFTSTSSSLSVVAVKANSNAGLRNVIITNNTGTNLHSLAQLTGTEDGTIDNNTVDNSDSFINVSGGKGDFAISNNTFTSSSEDGYAVRENAESEAILTLTDNTFTAFKAVQLGKGAKKTNGTINVVSGTYVGDIVKDIAATATGKIVISGGKFSAPLADAQYAEFIAEGLCGVNGLYEGDAPNGIGEAIATVTSGETVLKYASLEAAIAAAVDGSTVTLLKSTSGNGIKVPEGKYSTGLTVDFGGFTYTVDGTTVGSTGTETQAFQLLKDNKITFKNGTIYSEKAKMLVQNYSDLTLQGMTLDGSALVGSSNVYTLSNNNGNVVIENSTITAKAGTGNFAFDVCRYASYPSVSVTVKGTSEINGNIEVFASNNDPKDGFGLTLEAGTFNGNIVLDASAEAVLNATPEKAVIKKSNSLTTVTAPQDYKWVDNGNETSTLKPCEYVAQIGDVKYESLTDAVNAATTGQTIELLADITTETGNKSLKEGVTLDGKGKTISGDIAIYISKNGGTVQNVNFKNIHNTSKNKSAIYSESLEGTATITGCTFDNCDWDAIQITPIAGANVVITNNTFSNDTEDGIQQQRYIHVQSKTNVDFSATITGNVLNGKTAQDPLGVYYPTDKTKVDLKNNYIENVDDICILITDNNGYAGELVFPAYTTAAKEETYTPEAYIQNDQYSAKFYMTFAEAATAAGNDKVISLVTKPSTAYTMSEGQTLKVKKNGKSITVNGPAGYVVTSTTTDGVTTYTLVEAAVKYAATNGTESYLSVIPNTLEAGTYTLLKDLSQDNYVQMKLMGGTPVTIDLNGHNFTYTGYREGYHSAIFTSRNSKTLNIVNNGEGGGVISATNENIDQIISVQNSNNNVTIGAGVIVQGCVTMFGTGNNLTIEGTINGGNDFAVATNGSTTKNATITINDGAVLTSNVTAMYLPGTGTTTISGGTITGSNGVYVKSGELNITGGEITGNGETAEFVHNPNGTSIVGAALVVENCSYPGGAPTVNVTGGTFTSANADAIASYSYGDGNEPIGQFVHGGYFSTELDKAICEEGKKTVPSTVKEGYYELGDIVYVAQIGETKYETLEEAWNAVNDGETITLLANCEGNGLIAPQGKFTNGLTVDFAGFTYSVTGNLVGSTGTESQGFQLLKDNKITFKNGTVYSEKALFLVQNYSNLTLEGMTLTLNNANYASAYTLSNNNGNVVIDGTTINANPAGGFAFDVCRYSSYPSVSVTVTGNSEINGDVEVSASGSDAKDGFKLMFESATLNGEIVLDASAKTAMDNTPDNAKVSKNNTLTDIVAPDGYDWKDNGDGTSSLALTEEMEMVLIHGVPYPVTKTATYKKVTYKRTFETRRLGKYQCWFVPFDYTITGEENAEFYKVHMISASADEHGVVTDNTTVNIYIEKMNVGDKLTANKPYIIVAKQSEYEFVVEPESGITLYAPKTDRCLHVSTAEFDYDFYGTYNDTKATKNRDWMSLLASGSIAWNATADATLKSYVWYIKITANSDNADYSKITFSITEDSENATSINGIESDMDEIEGIYTTNGLKVDEPVRGINIIRYKNGKTKKVIIK